MHRVAEAEFEIIRGLVLDGGPSGASQFEKGLNTFDPAALRYVKPSKLSPPSQEGLTNRMDAVKKVTH
jgi:hypothetical protein